MKKYDSYKDSEIEWVGIIPKHWLPTQTKHVVNIQGRVGYKGYTVGDLVSEGEGPYTLGAKHINKSNQLDLTNPEYISWEKYYESPEIMVKQGDLLLTQRGTLGKVVLIENEIGEATINPSMVLLNKLKASGKFLYYFFSSNYFISWIDFTNTATAVPMISQEQLGNFKIVLPSTEEQTAIANFLDHKTAQIDNLIRKKEKLIELLQEERTAIINQAVTKGLNPNVPMKESGIEWLGEIPEHWEVKKLKYISHLINEKVKDKPKYILALENIESWTGNVLGNPFENEMQGEAIQFEKGDILFNKLRPYLAKVALADRNGGAIGELLVIRPNNFVTSEFLYHRLRSEMIITVVDGSTYGTKMPRASWDKFISHLQFGIPSIDEQKEIVDFIERFEIKNQSLIEKFTQEIELLKEYKTTLISEVVTGKVDVRNEITN